MDFLRTQDKETKAERFYLNGVRVSNHDYSIAWNKAGGTRHSFITKDGGKVWRHYASGN